MAKLELEQQENTFKPNREQTKKVNAKFKIAKSPERMEKYY